MFKVSIDDLIWLHNQILKESGGLNGVRDQTLLESALARPYQTAFGDEIHDNVFDKAAAMLYSLANNHGFLDGNKRTAMAATALFLFSQGIWLRMSNEEFEQFMLRVVNEKPSLQEISVWIEGHSEVSKN